MTDSEPPRFLLLLPPIEGEATAASLKQAYEDTLSQVLKEAAAHSAEYSKAAVLEIALSCPHLVNAATKSRSSLFQKTQSLVAAVYKLVCVIAARDQINVEDDNGVDVRIILVAYSCQSDDAQLVTSPTSIIVDLRNLASSGRTWSFALGVESEAGAQMVQAFVAARNASSGAVQSTATSTESHQGTGSQHYHVAVGGTFDHLHIGHKLLLTMTVFAVDDAIAPQDRSVTVGITGDQLLVKKKHAQHLEDWTDRQRAVATFINAILDFSTPVTGGQRHVSVRDDPVPNGKSIDIRYRNNLVVKCTEIQDPFGPTITDEQISALIISGETRAGGQAVNDKRKEKGWAELEVFEVDVLDADEEGAVKEGFESKLSSTAIREKLATKTAS